MASKAVEELLKKAEELAQNDTISEELKVELDDNIEALHFVGDEANGNSQEYKDLKDVVARVEEELLKKAEEDEVKSPTVEKKERPKKLNYKGIKQIGSLWYCSKDNYKTSFDTADECALYHNH